jgi:hypothetical protein
MAFDYATIRVTADASIRAAGASFTLNQFADDLDADTGEVSRGSTSFKGAAVMTLFESKDIDGTLVLEKDVKFIVSGLLDSGAAMPEPKSGDEAEFAGVTYECMGCKPYNFNGVISVGFEIHARAVAHG